MHRADRSDSRPETCRISFHVPDYLKLRVLAAAATVEGHTGSFEHSSLPTSMSHLRGQIKIEAEGAAWGLTRLLRGLLSPSAPRTFVLVAVHSGCSLGSHEQRRQLGLL